MAIDYSRLANLLSRLQEQVAHNDALDPNLPGFVKEAITESIIQRFETCFDSTWNTLKRYLTDEEGILDVPNTPKAVLRFANDAGVLPDNIETWFEYLRARNATAHDYNQEKANATAHTAKGFVNHGIALFETLTNKPWQPTQTTQSEASREPGSSQNQ